MPPEFSGTLFRAETSRTFVSWAFPATRLVVSTYQNSIPLKVKSSLILAQSLYKSPDNTLGEDIGSSYIDRAFQELAFQKLKEIGHLCLDTERKLLWPCAWKMMVSADFQNKKHDLGRHEFSADDSFYVKIPVPVPRHHFAEVQNVTEDGHLRFSW